MKGRRRKEEKGRTEDNWREVRKSKKGRERNNEVTGNTKRGGRKEGVERN